MIAGASATIFSFLGLAWTRELVSGSLGLFGADRDSQGVKTVTIVVAVIFIYVLDFAINTSMIPVSDFCVFDANAKSTQYKLQYGPSW